MPAFLLCYVISDKHQSHMKIDIRGQLNDVLPCLNITQ